MKQRIYANKAYNYRDTSTKAPRYDVVLVRNKKQGRNLGLRAFDLFRIRLFFSFTWPGKRFELCLGDWITLVSMRLSMLLS